MMRDENVERLAIRYATAVLIRGRITLEGRTRKLQENLKKAVDSCYSLIPKRRMEQKFPTIHNDLKNMQDYLMLTSPAHTPAQPTH